jgi:hypothetical protein
VEVVGRLKRVAIYGLTREQAIELARQYLRSMLESHGCSVIADDGTELAWDDLMPNEASAEEY